MISCLVGAKRFELAQFIPVCATEVCSTLTMTTTTVRSSLKMALRNRMKGQVLKAITPELRDAQSKAITEKVLQSEAFRQAHRVSIYLSTSGEVDTTQLLCELFRLDKQVFVPTYKGASMEMVRLRSMRDYEDLPLTKWNIKQPDFNDTRENALTNGHGIDLFILPGVAFSRNGGRLGHGMGYYDTFLRRHMEKYPQKKTTLMAVSFLEQIVPDDQLPMEANDVRLHCIMTPDD